MKTDELISVLSEAAPQKPRVSFVPGAAALMLASLAVICVWKGARADLAASVLTAGFWFKTAFLTSFFSLALYRLKQSAVPSEEKPDRPMMLMLLWGMVAVLSVYEVLNVSVAELTSDKALAQGAFCIGYVSVYGLVAMFALLRIMQAYAPVRPKRAAMFIGLAAAAAASLGYSLHCSIDTPSYVLIAYGVPALLLTLVSVTILPRFMRW